MDNNVKKELNALSDKVINWGVDNKSALLTAGTIGGYMGGIVLSNLQTAKVIRAIDSNPDMNTKTKLKLYSGYIPAALLTGGATFCSLKEHKNYIADVGALTVTALSYKSELKALRDSIKENVSKTKKDDIEAIADRKVIEEHWNVGEWAPLKPGEFHVYNTFDSRKFNITLNELDRVINKINSKLHSDMYIEYNYFYYLQEMDQSEMGSACGWHCDFGLLEYSFTTHEFDEMSGEPVLYLKFSIKPRPDYRNPKTKWDPYD